MYNLQYTDEAKSNLAELKKQGQIAKLKKIKKALDRLQENPRHPGLHTHKYKSFSAVDGDDIFQSYVENKTPSAYRIFWHYGAQKQIIIIAITPHP